MSAKKNAARPPITPEQRARYAEARRAHAAEPVRQVPATAIDAGHFRMILDMLGALRAERERQGLSLAELATRMGTDASTLSRLETGKTLNPTIWTLCKWAQALGRRVDTVLAGG